MNMVAVKGAPDASTPATTQRVAGGLGWVGSTVAAGQLGLSMWGMGHGAYGWVLEISLPTIIAVYLHTEIK